MLKLSPGGAARLRKNFRGLSVIIFALTAMQAFLGASGFFRPGDSTDYTAIHEIIANALFPLAIILFGLVFLAQFQHRNRMIAWTGLLLIAIISQIGLGYSSRDDKALLAFHIPAGVAIFGCALVVMLLSFGLRFQQGEA
jgi:heme A synthase